MTLPPEFKTRMAAMLPDREKFLASYSETPHVGLRANTLKISVDKLKPLLPDIRAAVPWCGEGFYYGAGFRPGKSPYYHAGLFYIQEPSAMSSASVMDVSPGYKVLDICAAPGGKSTQLAAKLQGKGLLVANDISASRARALLKNVEMSGAVNCVITNEKPERLAERFPNYFDRILVDAPCSGEGMFRRDPDAMKAWAENKPAACVMLQREVLHFAAAMLKPGGRLMYSTCTFAPEENEAQISEFLSTKKDFSGIEITHALYGFESGIYGEKHTARIWQHRQPGEGHFMAYLQKSGGEAARESEVPFARIKKSKPPIEYFDFCEKHLNFTPEPITCHGNSFYLPPHTLPDLSRLRVLRAGLYLGDVLTKRFEPSQAFAMSLRPDEVNQRINFSINDEYLIRYLKGESFEPENEASDGWNLVTLDGFPLGWAKVIDGRLKNKYPKGWLMN